MRFALISDSHTWDNINYIYEYLKNKKTWKLDLIIINGDVLGENEIREGYGFSYNKKIFETSLNKIEILKKLTDDYKNLLKLPEHYQTGLKDEKIELELAEHIKNYVSHRYDQLFELLRKFSTIKHTYFNIGTYESPLHYKVLKELAWLLDLPNSYIRSIALLTDYRETFKQFLKKVNDPKLKKLTYIGGNAKIIGDFLIAGIPGLNSSSGSMDSMSEFQEKMTTDLINTVTRQLNYINKLIILNPTQGKLRKDPFAFRPSSLAVRKFVESLKGKLKHKFYIQSYHHFMTTHYYKASEFNFILNNSAVNNSLFNLIEISTRINCYDIDPRKDRVRKLKIYNYNLAEYDKPEERLALNYPDSKEIIEERKLKGCYYM